GRRGPRGRRRRRRLDGEAQVKRRVWKLVLAALSGLGLAVGGLLWSSHARATAVFQHHDPLVRDAIAAIRSRPTVVSWMLEPVLEGNGWDAFLRALDAV